MKTRWEDFHTKERFQPKYPADDVVRFVFTHFPKDLKERSNLKILDLGCGAGANAVFLAKEGFQTYATDISEQGLRVTEKRLKEEDLKAILENVSMEKQPFPDDFFDGVISFGVLYYNTADNYQKAVDEIYRTLKKGGKALIFTRTIDDYRFGKGEEVGKNTFVLNTKDTNEQDMVNFFLEKKDADKIFNKFEEIIIEKTETTFCNSQKKNSNWIIQVQK
ncbi:class I SAM-dependent methyltransferase [Patescibacteria group bacterium]|nr:class I SAM-dependent methyltransferase [Patescibacteria group bacterium]